MKKNILIFLFFTVHATFIFLHVHKHTLLIKNSYEQQKGDKQIAVLKEKKLMLTQELYALKDHHNIKEFATKKLNMQPYKLAHLMTLPSS
jgi:cell division protein FtsL